jgi:hypothetical protein
MPKRKRYDTFWDFSDSENANFFDKIYNGKHPIYELRYDDVNLDYNGKERTCWRLYSRTTGEPVVSIRSTMPYRLSVVWCVNIPGFWKSEERIQQYKAALPSLKTRTGNHSRHRCPNEWCCNPGHIQIGSRIANEEDKHFHFFLKKKEDGTAIQFMRTL